MRRARLTLLLAAVLAPVALSAQAHPLVGRWTVTMQIGTQSEDGVETPITDSGTLTVVSQGDSLVATLAMPTPPGIPERPPRRMAARTAAGPVVFVLASKMMLNENGNVSTRDAVSTFTLSASGDALTGSVTRRVEGLDLSDKAAPVTGKRASS